MREYALVRQAPAFDDLISLCFYPLQNAGSCAFEVIEPEYIDGSGINTQGNVTSETVYSYAVQDVSAYDYVLLPLVSKGTTNRQTGFRADPATGTINTKAHLSGKANVAGEDVSIYGLFKVDASQPYAVINALSDYHPAVIGIHVN